MDIKQKFVDCLLAYKKVSSTKDYQTYSHYTSFNIKEEDFKKEVTLFDVLKDNSEKIFKDVVIFNKKENDIRVINYVLFNKGNIILVKICNYEGDLYFKSKKEMLLKTSNNGEVIQACKKDPKNDLMEFKQDFIRYLNRIKVKHKKNSIKTCVLFTNSNLNVVDTSSYCTSNDYYNLEGLLKYIKELSKVRKINYSNLELPSFDKAYQMNKGFFNIVIVDDYFTVDNKCYPVSDFKFIVFNSNENENSLLIRNDATYASLFLNRKKINCNSKTNLKNLNIDFIAINTQLHKFKNPEYKIKELNEKVKRAKDSFGTSLCIIFVGLVLSLVTTIIYLVDRSKIVALILACIGGLIIICSLFNLLICHLQIRKDNKKILKYQEIINDSKKLETFNDDIELLDGEIVLKDEIPLIKLDNSNQEKTGNFLSKLFKKSKKK